MNILLSVLTTLGILLGTYNVLSFDSLKYFDLSYWIDSQKLSGFTEITSSNQLSAFPVVYNANLAKTIETGTTTISFIATLPDLATTTKLSSIGTINTGVWNGTEIGAAYGGRGSTSQSQYRLVLGGGSGGLSIATSTGSAGQILKSSGEGKNPFWATYAVDEAGVYNWTFAHTFSASTTFTSRVSISTSTPSDNVNLRVDGGALISGTTTLSNLVVASSTLSLNGLTYQLPSSQSTNSGLATTSLLVNNGNGGLIWGIPVAIGATSTAPGFTSTQTISHGLGRQPVLLEIHAFGVIDNGGTAEMATSFGMATSTNSSAQVATYSTTRAAATIAYFSNIRTATNGGFIIYFDDSGQAGADVSANLSDWNSNTFTLNWTANDVSAAEQTRNFTWKVQ